MKQKAEKQDVARTDVQEDDGGLAPGRGHLPAKGLEAVNDISGRRQQRPRR